jgi:predicted O-methyltransferase YrrM
LPPLVASAVAAARKHGFEQSCLPEHGRLLKLLAGGVGAGVIGETGTGCGVGLAWLASGAAKQARLVSVEHDASRAAVARRVFEGDASRAAAVGRVSEGDASGAGAAVARRVFEGEPTIELIEGDWRELKAMAPFDLLVLDGGGQGKGDEPPLDPVEWLRPAGLVVLDDFTPMRRWPPMHDGKPDRARLYWLEHPRLRAAEVKVTPTSASIIATFTG